MSTTNRQPVDRRALQKEVQIHSILKHENVLAFLGSVEYAAGASERNYVPGLYIVLELCAGGDLFDKIGTWATLTQRRTSAWTRTWRTCTFASSWPASPTSTATA